MLRKILSYFNSVALVNIAFWAVGIILANRTGSLWYLLTPLFAVVLNDVILYSTGKSIFFNDHGRAQTGYQWHSLFVPEMHSVGLDLGFNLYDGDIHRDRNQAQIEKFKHACSVLGINKKTRLIDLGCGWGDWLSYLKNEIGCSVEGLNITKVQALTVESRGIVCHQANVFDLLNNKELQKKLFGRFDVVTAWDTMEHWAKPGAAFVNEKKADAKQADTYKKAFWIMEHLLDPAGAKRVWISCLHQMRKLKGFNEWAHAFLMNSVHSGFYPFTETGLTEHAKNFDVNLSEDRTNDYVLTSLLNPSHFGWFHVDWTLSKICLVPLFMIIDPHSLYKWMYYFSDTWLWQFGYSPNAKNPVARLFFKALTLKPASKEEAGENVATISSDCKKKAPILV